MKIQRKHSVFILIAFAFLIFFYFSLPKPLFDSPTSYVVDDWNGTLLSASIAKDGQWRFPEPDSLPQKFVDCLIEFEDKRFYYHLGFDPIAFARALQQNVLNKKVVSGGSTLSMQVIRMARNRERSVAQKLWETFLAFRLEMGFSKAGILKLYAAHAPFGSNVVGLEAASWRYFGRSPENLSWAESATLAVLPNSPSLIHPGKNRALLLEKRNRLLDRLVKKGKISLEEGELAKLEPLPDKPHPLPQEADHLLAHFRSQRKTTNGDTRLHSTLDAELQRRVYTILERFQHKHRSNGIFNSAALVIHIPTDEVVVYQGNVTAPDDEAHEQYVDMIQSLRSPGSTLKPLLYAAMLHDGQILPKTLIADIPTQIAGYTPQNYDLEYDGAVPADRSLSRSLNIPAVRMLQQYRYQRFYNVLKELGFNSLTRNADHYGLSLILGGAEVSMWEISHIYAKLARQEAEIRNLDAASLYFMFQAMQEVMRPGEEALWEQFGSTQKIAWKTGTSFGFRDAWALGMTPEYLVCVWAGNADGEGRPLLTGIEAAAPALFEIFSALPQSDREFTAPLEKMIQTGVCHESGHLAGVDCPHIDTLYVQATGFKSSPCPYHQKVHLDRREEHRVNSQCYDPSEMVTKSWFVLPPAMAYYFKRTNAFYQELPPYLPGCQIEGQQIMDMIYPKDQAKIYLPLTHTGERGDVVFTVAHQMRAVKLFWHVNGEYIGMTESTHQMPINLDPGNYRLTLVDELGNRLEQTFMILKK